MGTFNGQSLVSELSRRLRDTANNGYPRATILNVLNRVQDCVNVRLGLVHNSATFTTGNTSLYSTSAIASDYAYPVQMFDPNQREIDLITYDRLVQQDTNWLRNFGNRPAVFSPIGRELLVVTPIPMIPMTLTLRYVKHTTALVDAGGAPFNEWPDEHKPLVLDLAEALLLLIPRDFHGIQEAINRAAPKLGLEDAVQIMRHGTPGDRIQQTGQK